MRTPEELLAIQNVVVGRAEGTDFLYEGEFDLTTEEIEYIRALGDEIEKQHFQLTIGD